MEKIIDYTKPIYWQPQYGSYDVCVPPYQGYQVTKELDPELFAEVTAYLAEHPEALVCEPVPEPPSVEQLLSQEMQQLLAYLASTDWYRLRKIETGAEIPVDVMTSGAAARARISEIRGLLES